MKTTALSKAMWRLQIFNSNTNKSGLLHFATLISCPILESEEVPTIATDGISVIYNPTWWNSRPIDDQVFALAHEAMHIEGDHGQRFKSCPDPMRMNIACDIWNNHFLIKEGHKPSRDIYIDGAEYGISNPDRMTIEQIYKALPANAAKRQPGKGKAGGIGSGKDMVPVKATSASVDSAVKLEQIKQVAKGLGYDLSKLPTYIEEAYQEATAPKKDWKEECYKFAMRMRESHWSTSVFMPAYRARRILMPSIKRHNKMDFAFIIDTSGSIEGETYSMFIETVKDAFSQLKPERMIAVLADDLVRDEMEFTALPDKIPFKGRGGTDFCPGIQHIQDKYPDIGGVIYLTDGYGYFPKEPPTFPMLWAIDNHHVSPPFGDVCRI